MSIKSCSAGWARWELEGRDRKEGEGVYVVPHNELTGQIFVYTAHVINLNEAEGNAMILDHNRSFKHLLRHPSHILHTFSPTTCRSTWTLTLVYSSPWTLLERGMEEDRSSQTISSSCFGLSPCQNQTMSRLLRLSSSLRDSKRPRLLEESW